MRLAISWVLFAAALPGATFSYQVAGDDGGPWPNILSSIGLSQEKSGSSNLFVVRGAAAATPQDWLGRIEKGAVVVLEGDSPLAQALGIRPTAKKVVVRSIVDQYDTRLSIVWEHPAEIPVFQMPKEAGVLAVERWESAPLIASLRRGSGGVLWLAVSPGAQGYERFPYLLQALREMGIEPPFRSRRMWAFFDSAYRLRVDPDYFAARWRDAGFSALHVAAWHYFEPDAEGDEYLQKLIEACHRKGILVYAWLELPHVSERFWAEHPEWREKTALQQDAQLDWRKLMNLQNPAAADEVVRGVRALIHRFDWDGVNLSELYFESLEGAANPARFTPMNDDVRRNFQQASGFDPLTLFQGGGRDEAKLKTFLDYRADLARQLQTRWITEIEAMRREKPDLDLVLTHVDDRFDPKMRDMIGADAGKVLPLLDSHDFTFLVEDPATIWNLGPARYPQIAERYRPLTARFDKLGIDLNVVERYQDVYPTKQQTGGELFQLVHTAVRSFPQVALYFESSILMQDVPLLSAAAASVDRIEQTSAKLLVSAKNGIGVRWQGAALVNGRLWPLRDANTLWLPPGDSVVEPAPADAPMRVLDFNGGLRAARVLIDGVELAYESSARGFAIVNVKPRQIELDGAVAQAPIVEANGAFVITLPRGQHLAKLLQ